MDHPPAPSTTTTLTGVDVVEVGVDVVEVGREKCSVKSCGRVPEDKGFKMCARCRRTQARQAKKRREKKREKRIKDGTLKQPRAPIGVGITSFFPNCIF
jgi:hypothetical protein